MYDRTHLASNFMYASYESVRLGQTCRTVATDRIPLLHAGTGHCLCKPQVPNAGNRDGDLLGYFISEPHKASFLSPHLKRQCSLISGSSLNVPIQLAIYCHMLRSFDMPASAYHPTNPTLRYFIHTSHAHAETQRFIERVRRVIPTPGALVTLPQTRRQPPNCRFKLPHQAVYCNSELSIVDQASLYHLGLYKSLRPQKFICDEFTGTRTSSLCTELLRPKALIC